MCKASTAGGDMAAFKEIPMGENGLLQVFDWIDDYVGRNRLIAEKIIIGTSKENRPIPAVRITNRDISDLDKQTAVATLCRHGQEIGARMVGPEILTFLASKNAKIIRDRQVVIVVPVVNPDGFVRNEFHSSRTSLTKTERLVLGKLFNRYPPDAIIDYHSLGRDSGSKNDRGDMEVIIPANTTRWAMDEQIHQHVAQKMREASEREGFPYEIHTLEDLAGYYFGETRIGNMPWTYMQEKVYLLHMQDAFDNYDIPESSAYTNYTCGPAYLKWHSLVFGIETNHWALNRPEDIARSGLSTCKALLQMGNERFPWEPQPGYPVNLLHGDFRISLRPVGRNADERRTSRIKLWNERMYFSMLQREMPDPETTVSRVRYFGQNLPLEFALCIRMRQKGIQGVFVSGKEIPYETFEDICSVYVTIPLMMEQAGTVEIVVRHDPYKA